MTRVAWAALIAVWLLASVARAPALDVVHVEGNVGGASGGHTALRVGDVAFHYQHDGDVFRLVREPWASFEEEYTTFQNRPLHVAALEVGVEVEERVWDHLTALHLRQLGRLRDRESARRDRALLEVLTGRARGVPVTAAGLLAPERRDDAHAAALRARVDAALVAPLAARRDVAQRAFGRALIALEGGAAGADPVGVRDALALAEALRALHEAHGLSETVVVDLAAEGVALAPLTLDERGWLARTADGIVSRIVALLDSPRPDRGVALLRAQARWLAIQRTLEGGRWITLDPYGDGAREIPPHEVRVRRREFAAFAEHGREVAETHRTELVRGEPGGARLQRFEELLARTAEAARGARGGPMRDARGRLLPSRSRAIAFAPRPGSQVLERALSTARAREREVESTVARLDGYDLLRRNCATELQRALVDGVGGAGAERAALGGTLAAGEGLSFIPWRYFRAVTTHYGVETVERVPSYRERLLDRLYADLDAAPERLRVRARERSVPTSTLYTPRDKDGRFVFFTDDLRWLRPLYGAANLAVGLGETGVGLVTAPFDRGRRLRLGFRGVLFSVPELAFWNVRKGSYDLSTLPPLTPASR